MKINATIRTILFASILVAGCDQDTPDNNSPSSQQPIDSITSATLAPIESLEPKPSPVVLEGFPMPMTSGNRIYFYHDGDLTGWTIDRQTKPDTGKVLQVYRTDTRGVYWTTSSYLPTEQAWESEVTPNHIFTSFHQNGISLILLQSEPAGSVTHKELYQSIDSGATWTNRVDLTSVIPGDITSMKINEDGLGFITSSFKKKGVIPLYRTTNGGKSWILQKFTDNRDFQSGIAFPVNLGMDGVGTVRVDYFKDEGAIADPVYYETIDDGASWHLFETASILRFQGNLAALETIKRFADGWLAKDEQKVVKLVEEGAPLSMIEPMKKRSYTFISAFPPSNTSEQGATCVGLQYQTDDKDNPTGTMAVCVRKQPNSNEWRVYMLD